MGDLFASVVYRPGIDPKSGIHFSGGVLVGGRSRRMGFPKSRILLDGETLLHRQLRLLGEAGASELLVSVNPESPESPPLDLPARIVPDRIRDCGPMSGIEALLRASQSPWVAIVAVDLPRLDISFIRDLLRQVTSTSGVIPLHEGRLEPLCAVYPRGAAVTATQLLEEGRLEATGLAETGIREGWLHPWSIPGNAKEQLTNWNHPWELAQIRRNQSSAKQSQPCESNQGDIPLDRSAPT